MVISLERYHVPCRAPWRQVGIITDNRGGVEGDGGGGAIQRVERVDPPALVEGALAEVRPPPARAASRSPSREPSRASDHLKAPHPVAGADAPAAARPS